MYQNLPASAVAVIKSATIRHLNNVSDAIANPKTRNFDGFRYAIHHAYLEDYDSSGLDVAGQLALLQQARDYEFVRHLSFKHVDVPIFELGYWLSSRALAVLLNMADEQAQAIVGQLQIFMEKHQFKLEALYRVNRLSYLSCSASRQYDPNTRIYEYLNVDGHKKIDVWEVRFGDTWTIYLERKVGD